jgi:hypothetical protein
VRRESVVDFVRDVLVFPLNKLLTANGSGKGQRKMNRDPDAIHIGGHIILV